jgi:predicted secreted hydrolase
MKSLSLRRRWLLLSGISLPMGSAYAATAKPALPKIKMSFPSDAGAHTDFATEWWYVTGYANVADKEAAYGFQLTFFRSRVAATQNLQSKLAAKQLLFAHAAITDVSGKRLWHDQRLARWSGAPASAQSLDTAWASKEDTHIELRDWSLKRDSKDLVARLEAANFSINLKFVQTQSVLLQGDEGLSRKGPSPSQASYYYSLPQLQASGSLTLAGKNLALSAGSTAWLDHEWSNELLDATSVGWDWIGINLFDGSALTAFQLRDKGGAAVWDGGSFRAKDKLFVFHQGEVTFKPTRSWRSALTKAAYPVEWMVRTPADFYTVKAVIDNQELDSTNSTGAVYWEGLCEVWDSNNRKVGRGYLEMTGYASPLKI